MSDATVFYAWQSDTDESSNRFFIRDCLKSAIKKLNSTLPISEPVRLDHDTKGTPGTPTITNSLFSKIDDSAIFVADVSLTFRSNENPQKFSPNPNVLLELGYAANRLEWGRIVLVMNTFDDSGEYTPEKQIFDLRNRSWPTIYRLRQGAGKAERKECREKFIAKLVFNLQTASQSGYSYVTELSRRLDQPALEIYGIYGNKKWFSLPHIETIGDAVSYNLSYIAVARMLDLRLLRCESDQASNLYAYHWTHLGKAVGRTLGSHNDVADEDPLECMKYARH